MRDGMDEGSGTNAIGVGMSSPLVLRSSSSRIGKAAGIFLFTALWNGIVSVFVVQIVRGAIQGSFQWFVAIFLIPFVLVGLAVFGLLVHAVLGIFAPRVAVTLSRQRIHLGDSIDIEWQFTGRVHIIENLRVFVEGSEEATYRRGTSTATDRHVFARIEINRTSDVNE